MSYASRSVQLLGFGSLAFGVWGLASPRSLTALMGDDPAMGRVLGARDLLVGSALLTLEHPLPIALRLASDVHDAVRLRERSPLTALGAVIVAAWGASVLIARQRSTRG